MAPRQPPCLFGRQPHGTKQSAFGDLWPNRDIPAISRFGEIPGVYVVVSLGIGFERLWEMGLGMSQELRPKSHLECTPTA